MKDRIYFKYIYDICYGLVVMVSAAVIYMLDLDFRYCLIPIVILGIGYIYLEQKITENYHNPNTSVYTIGVVIGIVITVLITILSPKYTPLFAVFIFVPVHLIDRVMGFVKYKNKLKSEMQ